MIENIKANTKILVLAIAVVCVWRGTWGILDLYLFPNNSLLSFIVSIAIGLLILYTDDRSISELK